MKCVIPNFVACFVFLGMAFSFIKLISSSDTLTKREAVQPRSQGLSSLPPLVVGTETLGTRLEAVILKFCPPAIITSAEVIIAEYDAILGQ